MGPWKGAYGPGVNAANDAHCAVSQWQPLCHSQQQESTRHRNDRSRPTSAPPPQKRGHQVRMPRWSSAASNHYSPSSLTVIIFDRAMPHGRRGAWRGRVRRPSSAPLRGVLTISSRPPIAPKNIKLLQREMKTRASDRCRRRPPSRYNSKHHRANLKRGKPRGDARRLTVLCNASGRLTIASGIPGFPCSIRVRTRWTREAVDALGSVSPQ